jgi:hypothetical protein
VKIKTFLFALIIIILLSAGLGFKKLESRSVASPTGRLNIAIYNPKVGIWVLAVEQESVKGVFISSDIYIKTARGGGKYKVSKLGKLGEIEGNVVKYIKESVSRFLKIPIDGVLISDKAQSIEDIDAVVLNNKKSNLSFWDLLVVWKRLTGNVLSDANLVDLEKTRSVAAVKNADGVITKEANEELFPIQLRQLFIEAKLAKEKASIAVVNGTDAPNLAQLAANIIENTGLDVVVIRNSNERFSGCKIRVEDKLKNSLSFKRLKQIFSCQIEEKKVEGPTVDIEIYIGSKFSKEMFGI